MIRTAWLLLTTSLLAAGCARSGTAPATGGVPYKLGDKDGQLTMTLGQLTLLFEGIPAEPGTSGSGGTLFVSSVPGAGGGGSAEFGKVSIKYKEANMVCTVTVQDTVTFQLTDGGASLVLGGKTYPVNTAQTVVVGKDGTPR